MASANLQDNVHKAGITEDCVHRLVATFYRGIRDDAVLGPVFIAILGTGSWQKHIETITQFWLTAVGLSHGYRGRSFMPAHARHHTISPDLAPRWLELFDIALKQECTSNEADAFRLIAEAIMENILMTLAKRDRVNNTQGTTDHL